MGVKWMTVSAFTLYWSRVHLVGETINGHQQPIGKRKHIKSHQDAFETSANTSKHRFLRLTWSCQAKCSWWATRWRGPTSPSRYLHIQGYFWPVILRTEQGYFTTWVEWFGANVSSKISAILPGLSALLGCICCPKPFPLSMANWC